MRRRTAAIILVAVVASFFIGYLSLAGNTLGFPRKLGSMTLTNIKSESESLSELSIMHEMSPAVVMNEAFIVDYAGMAETSAIVYVSSHESEEQAQELLDLMNSKIDPSDGYTYVREMNLPGDDHPTVYFTEGHGAYHYLWAKGEKLYWIALKGLSLTMRLDFLEESLETLP